MSDRGIAGRQVRQRPHPLQPRLTRRGLELGSTVPLTPASTREKNSRNEKPVLGVNFREL